MKMNPYQRREEEYRILTEKMQQVEKSYAISKARSIFDEKIRLIMEKAES